MTEIKPLGAMPAASAKKEFVKSKTVTAPRGPKVKSYDQEEDLDPTKRICLFGSVGSGKTYALYQLLEMGLKVFYLSTDVGGGGVETAELECINRGRTDLLKNLRSVDLGDYDEVQAFLEAPESVYPDIYDFDPDVLFWDGFACYQQVNISEHVGSMSGGRDSNAAVSEGLQMETQQWGQIRNATIRAISNFCALYNTKTGKKWHKVVTAHEEVKMVEAKQRKDNTVPMREQGYPMISGKAFNLFNGAFTTIVRTVMQDGQYYYSVGEDNKVAKTRGFKIENEGRMVADMSKLWALMSPQQN